MGETCGRCGVKALILGICPACDSGKPYVVSGPFPIGDKYIWKMIDAHLASESVADKAVRQFGTNHIATREGFWRAVLDREIGEHPPRIFHDGP